MKRTIYILIITVTLININSCSQPKHNFEYEYGAIVRGDKSQKELALVFTGDKYADGGKHIIDVLKRQELNASFFFTGNFYRNSEYKDLISKLISEGHYIGAHSDNHLLYCDWTKRDSLLVTKEGFTRDLADNYLTMEKFGLSKEGSKYFLPPFEWYNDSISFWTSLMGLQLVNITHGTLSHTDYTVPGMKNYRSSQKIYNSILKYEKDNRNGLNGFLLLSHIGTHPDREDKFYYKLEKLIIELKNKGYKLKKIDALLAQQKKSWQKNK